ncbi:hypothetical protein Tco_0860316 [Tanacetum coccineum]|uniref:Uncharacterized protein n=1 Tax=Tanacetum coccineum TaxID=301880 RepID=A0ABQ5BIL9_9ASTR
MQAPLRARFRDLPTVDMKEILQQRMRKLVKRDERDVTFQELLLGLHLHRHHHHLLQQAQSKCSRNFRASWSFSVRATPPPLSIGAAQQQGSKAPSSSKTASSASQSISWTTSDTQFESTNFMAAQELSPTDSLMQDDSIPDEQILLSDDEDSGNDHLPKSNSRQDWWKPLPKEERPATPKPAWTIPFSHKSDWRTISICIGYNLSPQLRTRLFCKDRNMAPPKMAYEVVKAFYPDVIHLQFQMEECHKMLTDQVDWAETGRVVNKGSCPALSISKMKAASYPDFGLELLVPEQMWIDDVCTYDVSAKYGISHWWFTRQKFYIDRHDSPSRQKDVRTHMRILSVVRIKAYSRYDMTLELNCPPNS